MASQSSRGGDRPETRPGAYRRAPVPGAGFSDAHRAKSVHGRRGGGQQNSLGARQGPEIFRNSPCLPRRDQDGLTSWQW